MCLLCRCWASFRSFWVFFGVLELGRYARYLFARFVSFFWCVSVGRNFDVEYAVYIMNYAPFTVADTEIEIRKESFPYCCYCCCRYLPAAASKSALCAASKSTGSEKLKSVSESAFLCHLPLQFPLRLSCRDCPGSLYRKCLLFCFYSCQ